jgi:hypothetical protein
MDPPALKPGTADAEPWACRTKEARHMAAYLYTLQ